MTVNEALKLLEQKRRSMRCSEMRKILEQLGFTVKRVKATNHYLYSNRALIAEGFFTGSFSCEHGRDGDVRMSYVQEARRVIETHADRLRAIRGEKP